MAEQGRADARGTRRLARWRTAALLPMLVPMLAPLLVGANVPAHAHSGLLGSTPTAGDTVTLDSDRLVLMFSEELAAGSSQVTVLDEQALDTVSGDPHVTGPSLEVPLALRSEGRHEVTYRVVSGDGHVIVGDFEFVVGSAGPADARDAVARSAAATPASGPGAEVARVVWGGGAVLVVLGLVLLPRLGRNRGARPDTGSSSVWSG